MRGPQTVWIIVNRLWLVLVLATLLLGARSAWAGTPGQAAPAELPDGQVVVEQITAEQVHTRLEEIAKSEALDDPTKARLGELYQQVLAELDLASKRETEAAVFAKMIQTVDTDLVDTERLLEEASTLPPVVPPANADLSQLKQKLGEAEEALGKAQKSLEALEAEPKRRATRKKDIPGLLTTAREDLSRVTQQLLGTGKEQDLDPLAAAERALLLAQYQRYQRKIAALESEVAAYDATGELLRCQRDLAFVQVLQNRTAARQWRDRVSESSMRQAADKSQEARRAIDESPEELRPLAEVLQAYASECEEVCASVRASSEQLAQVKARLEDLQKQYTRCQERVDAVGLTYAVGLLLRTRRMDLPDRAYYDRRRRARQPEIRKVHLKLFDLQDRRAEMGSLDRLVEVELERLGWSADDVDGESSVRELLTQQRTQLDALIQDYEEYFDSLSRLDDAELALTRKAADFANYIDQRVFWIGSTGPLRWSDWQSALGGLSWLVSPDNWRELGRASADDVENQWELNLFALCILAALLWRRRRLRQRLVQLGEAAGRSTECRIFPTCQALLLTVLITATGPALLAYSGWRLLNSLRTAEFVGALGLGLLQTAAVLLPLELARQVCRRGGLGEAHFGWPAGALQVVRRNLKWFMLLLLPLVFMAATLHAQSNERFDNSLGRMGAIVGLLLVPVFVHRVLRPTGGFYRQMSAAGWEGWPFRLRHLWYALGMLVPIALALLAARGYYYTSGQLAKRLWESACVPLGLAAVGALLYRWVMVARRRLAIDRSRKLVPAAAAEAVARGEAAAVGGLPAAPEPEVDLAAVTKQTRRLIHSGLVVLGLIWLGYIWVDALPALGYLEKVPVWPLSAWSGGEADLGTGGAGITLADLALLVLVVVMTVIASKNLPGLLEISIPRQLPIDAGARYAITTVSRYLITLVGLVLACHLLGIRWSSVQWLVAALGVGLGFGLQEVFANFICGLILLFERPIRVGDIVTVGDVTGVVSRIQIRATTVTNWDRKELIVPNKEFITGRMLNWTLSDPVNRVVVNVGIAYGSDTDRARELLLMIAREHPLIVNDPAPLVTFQEFGDSSLNLVLRCFLPDPDHRLQVIHDLHTAIHRIFKQEGVEIAFPQRDLHLRSAVPLVQIVGQEEKAKPQR